MSEMRKKIHTSNDVTEQILFCQNEINNLNISSKDISVRFIYVIPIIESVF